MPWHNSFPTTSQAANITILGSHFYPFNRIFILPTALKQPYLVAECGTAGCPSHRIEFLGTIKCALFLTPWHSKADGTDTGIAQFRNGDAGHDRGNFSR